MTEPFEQLGTSVAGLARLWRAEVDRRLKPLGMSEARWLALHHLAKNGGELTQGRLAEQLGVRGPTLVGQLDGLEADGWVERHSSTHDRRSKIVRLTERAAPMVVKIQTVIGGVRNDLFADIDEDEVVRCLQVIHTLRERIMDFRARHEANKEPPISSSTRQRARANGISTFKADSDSASRPVTRRGGGSSHPPNRIDEPSELF